MYQDSKGLPYMKTTVAVKTLKGIFLKSCRCASSMLILLFLLGWGGGGVEVEDVLRSALKFLGERGRGGVWH